MKAVILAAGKSTRTYPLTLTKPKPLLKIAGKTLIEHNLGQLIGLVDEAIIIIGYKGSMIKKQLGDKFDNIKITYVKQKQQMGTGHAVMQAEKFVKGERFIVMMGDDLYFRGDMRKCIKYDLSVMGKRVENYSDFGVFIKKDGRVFNLIEKPKKFVSDFANAAFYVFNDKIFHNLKKIKKSPRGEYELTDGLKLLAKRENIFTVESKVWLPIGYPWDLLEADQIVRDDDVQIGKKTKIKGKVMDCSIGDNCVIEGSVKNSIIGDNVVIHKGSVVEDSIIGDNVEFRGMIKTTLDLEIKVKDKVIKVENFGAVIGDNSRLKDVVLESGTLVWPNVKRKNKELKGIVKR